MTKTTLKPMLSIGASGDQVRELQTKLAELGHYGGELDGRFGPQTRAAVLAAQKQAGLLEDAVVGPKTAERLKLPFEFDLPRLERSSFKQLLASQAWSLALSDTSYEALTCVGYQPEIDCLVAIVELRKPSGYRGNACSGGSREYVRFFVDWANDGNWRDVGVADFTATDGPFSQPRRFAVAVPLGAVRPPCNAPSYPRIRAILAWDDVPTDADFVPHWGNVVDVRVQIAPRSAQLSLAADIIEALAALELEPLALPALSKLYGPNLKAGKKAATVPVARYAAATLHELSTASTTQIAKLAPQIEAITGVSIKDSLAQLAKLLAGDGNTNYEELGCIGYDPDNRRLSGVITIKRPQGYSGDPCSAGSREYVGFWLWTGSSWTHLGTTSTRVYDTTTLPDGGLRYAVSLPVNLRSHQRPCSSGPVTLRIRAILSWNVDPTAAGPNQAPVWGNREEATIELPPLAATAAPGMFINTVGGVRVCDVDAIGYYDVPLQPAYNAPFGGVVTISGYFSDPPTSTSTAKPKYRISVRHQSDPPDVWQPLNHSFGVTLDTFSNAGNTQTTMTQVAVDGWYTYQEVIGSGGGTFVQVAGDVLGYWTPSKEGRHLIKVETMDLNGDPVPSLVTTCPDGSVRTIIPIMIDNTAPDVELHITHATRGAQMIPVGDCGKFRPGDVLHGTYKATDAYFDRCALSLRPIAAPNPPALVGVTNFDAVLDPVGTGSGEPNGTWSFDTAGLRACGYTLTLTAWDRARVNSSGHNHWSEASVGFCLTDAD